MRSQPSDARQPAEILAASVSSCLVTGRVEMGARGDQGAAVEKSVMALACSSFHCA